MGLSVGEGMNVEGVASEGRASAEDTLAEAEVDYPGQVSPVSPWIQVVELAWRPELGFFERRPGLLRRLEGLGLLSQFNWAEDAVTVKIEDYAAVRVSVNGAIAWVTGPSAGVDRARRVLTASLHDLKPQKVVFADTRLRYLAPIATAPKEAQRRSAQRIVGRTWADGYPTDWALLLDGFSERTRSAFQVEYGIVTPDEVRIRYSRPVGRIGRDTPVIDPDLENLPESAVFLDWFWRGGVRIEGDPAQGVVERWDALLSESERLSVEICDQIIPGYTGGVKEQA